MNKNIECDLLVVGGGPGGYVAAIKASQLGLGVVLVENDRLGGTCLIRGCIPSKALIEASDTYDRMKQQALKSQMGISLPPNISLDMEKTISWKDKIVKGLSSGVSALLKKAKVNHIQGWATFIDQNTCSIKSNGKEQTVKAQNIILACGSNPFSLPNFQFGGNIISSTEALELSSIPNEMCIIGGGIIGVELGCVYAKFGTKVTIIEKSERILPSFDKELVQPVIKKLRKLGVEILTNVSADTHENIQGKTVVHALNEIVGKFSITCDKVLITVGRTPNTEGWGRESLNLNMNGSFIKIDDQCRTNKEHIFAIGDLVGEPMLAHKASAQGEIVAEVLGGHNRIFDPVSIPSICYSSPEMVNVGMTESEAKAKDIEIITGKFPLAANGRAHTMSAADEGGFIRIIARKDNHVILGIQAVGKHVSELSGEYILALEMGACLEDITNTIHAHPSMTETLPEVALNALGNGLHS